MRINHFIAIILLINSACDTKTEDVIRIYPDQAISTDFIGNGVQWSA